MDVVDGVLECALASEWNRDGAGVLVGDVEEAGALLNRRRAPARGSHGSWEQRTGARGGSVERRRRGGR